MFSMMVGAVSNVILDALMIIVLDMGVRGAAWATILSQMIAVLWICSFYKRRKGILRFRRRAWIPFPGLLRRIATVGFSAAVTEMTLCIFMLRFNRAVQTHGGDLGVSTVGIFLGWDSLLILPSMAIGEAIQPIFGFNYGAGLLGRVDDALKKALIVITLYFLFSILLVYLFAVPMVATFTQDNELIRMAAPAMQISYCSTVFIGVFIVTNSFLQGLGMAKEALFLVLSRHLVILIPTMMLMPRFFGLMGVWYIFPVIDGLGGLLAMLVLLRQYRRLKMDTLNY
jgi:Na+-driven multidrug efflux pump